MFESPAFAQAAGAAAPSGGTTAFLVQFAPLILIFVIFYFLLIRPQQKRAQEHRSLVDAVKKGDTVVTGGGIVGKVTRVEDGEVEIEIAANVRVRVVKGTLADVRVAGSSKPAND